MFSTLPGAIFEMKTKSTLPDAESVWDYPRPPLIESIDWHLKVEHDNHVIAETRSGLRVLETSHPPCYYFPPDDVDFSILQPSSTRTLLRVERPGALLAYSDRQRIGRGCLLGLSGSGGRAYTELRVVLCAQRRRLFRRRGARDAAAGRFLRRLDHQLGQGSVQGRAGDEGRSAAFAEAAHFVTNLVTTSVTKRRQDLWLTPWPDFCVFGS